MLAQHGLIDHPHATVETTLRRMQEVGWRAIDTPQPGAVVTWPADQDGNMHIGFCVEDDTYMSNSSLKLHPILHTATLQDGRQPNGYYTHDLLS